jgi:hypothetical protein
MTQDLEFNAWMTDFKANPDAPAADVLVRRIQRETRKQRLSLAGEVLASAALVAFYGWLLVWNNHPVLVVLAMANMLFVGAWLTRLVTNLGGTWNAPANTARAYLALTLSRRKAAVRWAVFVQRCLGVMAAFGLLWIPWKLWVDWPMYAAEPWRGFLGTGGYYAIIVLLMVSMRRSERRAAADRDALLEELPAMQDTP